jgi:hypothetical protein
MCSNDPAGVTGEGERVRSIRGRRAEGGGSAGGGSRTVNAEMAKRAKDPCIMPVSGEALPTDTMGAKETEGPRASREGAGGESPEEDRSNPCPVKG